MRQELGGRGGGAESINLDMRAEKPRENLKVRSSWKSLEEKEKLNQILSEVYSLDYLQRLSQLR